MWVAIAVTIVALIAAVVYFGVKRGWFLKLAALRSRQKGLKSRSTDIEAAGEPLEPDAPPPYHQAHEAAAIANPGFTPAAEKPVHQSEHSAPPQAEPAAPPPIREAARVLMDELDRELKAPRRPASESTALVRYQSRPGHEPSVHLHPLYDRSSDTERMSDREKLKLLKLFSKEKADNSQ